MSIFWGTDKKEYYAIVFSRYGVPCMKEGCYDSEEDAIKHIPDWVISEDMHKPHSIIKINQLEVKKL